MNVRDQRDKLRILAAEAAAAELPLSDYLDRALAAADLAVADGKPITGSSVNGHSVTWQPLLSYSPVDARRLIGALRDRYDTARAALVAAGTAEPTDSEVMVGMLAQIPVVRSLRPDFSLPFYE